MLTRTSTKQKRNHWYSKDHSIGTTCDLIQDKVLSKFHRTNESKRRDIDSFEMSLPNSIRHQVLPSLKKTILSLSITFPSSESSEGYELTPCKEQIDWTRGRFVGNVQKIIIKDGVVVSKTFVTPRGTLITVKRFELGVFLNLFSN